MTITAESIARFLPKGHKNGRGWKACCPAHDDTNPSLDINTDENGKILVKCQSGCTQAAVIAALKAKGLWPNGKVNGAPCTNAHRLNKPWRKLIKTYDYVDATGSTLLYQKCRYDPKHFTQRRPDGKDGWIYDLDGVKQVPYRLAGLIKAVRNDRVVLIVEGEKDADALHELGWDATCNAGGARKWPDELTNHFADARVCIIPDNDKAGRDHADLVGRALTGVAAEIKILNLPGVPEKGDFSDWAAINTGPGLNARFRDLLAANAKPFEPSPPTEQEASAGEPFSEGRCARRFIDAHKETLRYNHSEKAWYRFDGNCWIRDDTKQTLNLIWQTTRDTASTESEARKANTASFCRGVEVLAQTAVELAASRDTFDHDPWLLGTPGGTVDLKTGELRPACAEDYISRLTAATPAASGTDCPRWLQFLDEATGGDAELSGFLQRYCGYALTGVTTEQCLVFLHGFGKNGKSTFVSTVSRLLGAYATTSAMSTFTTRSFDAHPEELASLAGARLVAASETQEGRTWDETRVKQLTGGDTIRARFMNKDSFTFKPAFKLLFVGNKMPDVATLDEAWRRRFHLVPFTSQPSKPDPELEKKLENDWPGILRWLIDGCLAWQLQGLNPSASVVAATEDYFKSQNTFGDWLAEKCDTGPDNPHKQESSSALFASWSDYAKAAGRPAGSRTGFGWAMRRHGFQSQQIKIFNGKGYRGIELKRPDGGAWGGQ
jgi:putative DNA primase/helicase